MIYIPALPPSALAGQKRLPSSLLHIPPILSPNLEQRGGDLPQRAAAHRVDQHRKQLLVLVASYAPHNHVDQTNISR